MLYPRTCAFFGVVLFFSLLVAAVPAAHAQQQAAGQSLPYLNSALPVDQRVKDLIGRMTLEEKVQQMRDHAPAIPRLGVPKYDWWNEGLHGVAFAGYATNFPQVIGMAATWDTNLVHAMAQTTSTEARAKYNQAMRDDDHEMFFGLTFWAPNVNIFRDPRWGRGQETYGEDPFLTGQMAVAFVSGMQGDDPKYLKSFPLRSIMPSIAVPSLCATDSTSMSRRMIWKTRICRRSARP